jgi:hypothetical protein
MFRPDSRFSQLQKIPSLIMIFSQHSVNIKLNGRFFFYSKPYFGLEGSESGPTRHFFVDYFAPFQIPFLCFLSGFFGVDGRIQDVK